jgi:hypothetical protein
MHLCPRSQNRGSPENVWIEAAYVCQAGLMEFVSSVQAVWEQTIPKCSLTRLLKPVHLIDKWVSQRHDCCCLRVYL